MGPEILKQHIGRRAVSTDVVTPGPANLLRLSFGRPELRHGGPLPPGWLCLYFLPQFPPDRLRPDGSPLDAGVVPPMPLPRRMFAGERVRWYRPIRIGDELRRETELADLTMKGRKGSRSRRSGAPCSARRSRWARPTREETAHVPCGIRR